MLERAKHFLDKSKWPVGPWQEEPDKVQWVDDATKLTCLAVRHKRSGHWCGYVGVTEGHPLFNRDYEKADVSVHGGLTFASFCEEDGKDEGICHTAEPGYPERVWWLGFDCAHCDDLSPHWSKSGVYRDLGYVRGECAQLAAQLAAMQPQLQA
jgi:hypothetical protein